MALIFPRWVLKYPGFVPGGNNVVITEAHLPGNPQPHLLHSNIHGVVTLAGYNTARLIDNGRRCNNQEELDAFLALPYNQPPQQAVAAAQFGVGLLNFIGRYFWMVVLGVVAFIFFTGMLIFTEYIEEFFGCTSKKIFLSSVVCPHLRGLEAAIGFAFQEFAIEIVTLAKATTENFKVFLLGMATMATGTAIQHTFQFQIPNGN